MPAIPPEGYAIVYIVCMYVCMCMQYVCIVYVCICSVYVCACASGNDVLWECGVIKKMTGVAVDWAVYTSDS